MDLQVPASRRSALDLWEGLFKDTPSADNEHMICIQDSVHRAVQLTNILRMLYKQLGLRLIVGPRAKFYSESLVASASVPRTTVKWSKIKPFSEIPGPTPLPVVRNILDFRRNSDRLIYYLEECYEKYGEIFKLEVPGQYDYTPNCG